MKFFKKKKNQYYKSTQKWLIQKVREEVIEEVTSEMGLQRLGFSRFKSLEVSCLIHSQSSHLGAASNILLWSLQSQFNSWIQGLLSFNSIINFSETFLPLASKNIFSLHSQFSSLDFPFLNPSLRYSHPLKLRFFFLIFTLLKTLLSSTILSSLQRWFSNLHL